MLIFAGGAAESIRQEGVLAALVAGEGAQVGGLVALGGGEGPDAVHTVQVVAGHLVVQDVRLSVLGGAVSVHVHLGRYDMAGPAVLAASITHVLEGASRIFETKATEQLIQLSLFLGAQAPLGSWSQALLGPVGPHRGRGVARVTADRQGVVAVVWAAGGWDSGGPSWDTGIRGALLSHLGVKAAVDRALRVQHWWGEKERRRDGPLSQGCKGASGSWNRPLFLSEQINGFTADNSE